MKKFQQESKIFGQRLRSFRTRSGLSAEAVANIVGVSPSTYREWENGRAITGLPYMNLALAFKMPVGRLFEDDTSDLIKDLYEAVENIDGAVKRIRSLL